MPQLVRQHRPLDEGRCRRAWVTRNIAVTMDTYTHLFPDTADDADKLAKAERALMSAR